MSEATGHISGTAVRASRGLRVLIPRLRRRLREVSGGEDLTASQTSALARLAKEGASLGLPPASVAKIEAVRGH